MFKKLRYRLTKNIYFENLKNALIRAPRAFFYSAKENFPGKNKTLGIIGITGTKGKTSVSFIVHHILSSKFRTSLISTIEARIGNDKIDTGLHVTSPEQNQIYKLLKKSIENKIEKVVLETTSHGLFQKRVAFIDFEVGIFTNIARDHLDYHPNFEHYLWSKSLLFRGKNLKLSVLNMDDELSFEYLRKIAKGEIATYSTKNKSADLYAEILEVSEKGTRFLVKIPDPSQVVIASANEAIPPVQKIVTVVSPPRSDRTMEQEFFMPVPGKFYVSNALAGIAVGLFYGMTLDEISSVLRTFSGVPGRMEKVDAGQNFTVFVDFAHTPDSLQKLLEGIREIRKSENQKIVTVFGNAGERDPERRKMGGVSARLADITILTSEDPRSESVENIMEEAAKYARENGAKDDKNLFKIANRRNAIKKAFEMAKEGDIVVLSGKGHEQSINLGHGEEPWDDRIVAREELKKLSGKKVL